MRSKRFHAPVRVVRSLDAMQSLALAWKHEGQRVGFVPTMGYLHRGHISLVERARRWAGPAGKVVVSIYVNPTQFAQNEDLGKYPRDFPRDLDLCAAAGADVVFAPRDGAMYSGGQPEVHSTWVIEDTLSAGLEGRSRPTHFRGVTTVVAKLFNLVLPDVAVFGAKDFQQAAVIQRMAANLNFPVRIIVAPTVREPDGVAMSSRNKYLTPAQRDQAIVLSRLLIEARKRVRASTTGLDPIRLREALRPVAAVYPLARIDYLEFFDPRTLEEADLVRRGTRMAVAAFLGDTRLIDNGPL